MAITDDLPIAKPHGTPMEDDLWRVLQAHAGYIIRKRELIEELWGYYDKGMEDSLRNLVCKVRKARPNADIVCWPGVGYGLRAADAATVPAADVHPISNLHALPDRDAEAACDYYSCM